MMWGFFQLFFFFSPVCVRKANKGKTRTNGCFLFSSKSVETSVPSPNFYEIVH